MRIWWLVTTLFLLACLPACQLAGEGTEPAGGAALPAVLTPAPTPTLALIEITTVPQPTPSAVTLTIWGPAALDPEGDADGAEVLFAQIAAFEQAYPEVRVVYEAKPSSGPASLMNYLRSSSAVAPSLVPDLILLPPQSLSEIAQTGLLAPLDPVIPAELRDALFPFATRDTRIDGNWLALPYAVQVEQGVVRRNERHRVPPTLDRLLRPEAPIWLFAAQAGEDGQMTNALLLQLLAISAGIPRPGNLPEQEQLIALLATLQAAQQEGTIPRQVLLLNDESLLFDRLEMEQVDLIESSSKSYLREQGQSNVTFAPLPTLTGELPTVVDGFLLALTTDEPRQQAAATLLIGWLFEPGRLAEWSRASFWLPARRDALALASDDEAYVTFLNGVMERGFLHPGGANWVSFAQTMQEQFRAVMTEQVSPFDAVEMIQQTFAAATP